LINGISPRGSIGGGINVVPKRATDKPISEFTGSYASDSQVGGGLDIGRRFGDVPSARDLWERLTLIASRAGLFAGKPCSHKCTTPDLQHCGSKACPRRGRLRYHTSFNMHATSHRLAP